MLAIVVETDWFQFASACMHTFACRQQPLSRSLIPNVQRLYARTYIYVCDNLLYSNWLEQLYQCCQVDTQKRFSLMHATWTAFTESKHTIGGGGLNI